MTKFTITAPVYDKWVKKSGDHIYKRGDQWIIRFSGTHKHRKYTLMWRGNHLFQSMSEYFKGIIPSAVEEWTKYKEYIGDSRSARNPFLKNNIQILYPGLVGTLKVDTISSPPQYPDIPICFAAYYDIDLDGIIYEWLDNYAFETIIEAGYYNAPGRVRPPLEWTKIGKGDLSGCEEIFLPGSKFNAGSITWATVRSINLRGEVSPWHDPIAIDIEEKPKANFSGAPRKGDSPLEVHFLDLTTGTVLSRLWTFGDGQNSDVPNPVHTYYGLPDDFFDVVLLTHGVADSKNKKTKKKYIKIIPEVGDPNLFITDTLNDRIHERLPLDLSYISIFGSTGTALGYYKNPFGITTDKYFMYICDYVNCRIIKRLKFEPIYVMELGSEGSGNDQFQYPAGITVDKEYVYICDRYNHRIIKRKKSDFTYDYKIGSQGSGNNQFRWPTGIAVDNTYIYIVDNGNHRIVKRFKSALSYDSQVGSQGAGDNEFNDPYGITVDNDHIYICDTYNHRIVKRVKSDLTFVSKIGSQGSGNNQFEAPRGISVHDDHLYICDTENNRIQKRLKSDLSFVSKIGSLGSGNNQFDNPYYLSIKEFFT